MREENLEEKIKSEIKEFNAYIERQMETRIDPNIPLDIQHLDSAVEKCLQAVDLFTWGIFRKYEKKDHGWFSIFKENVKNDQLYLP